MSTFMVFIVGVWVGNLTGVFIMSLLTISHDRSASRYNHADCKADNGQPPVSLNPEC